MVIALREHLHSQGISTMGCAADDLVPFAVLTHMVGCEEGRKAESKKLDAYHNENKSRFEAIKTMTQEQTEMLETLISAKDAFVAAKKFSFWTGRAVMKLSALIVAIAGALSAIAFWRTH